MGSGKVRNNFDAQMDDTIGQIIRRPKKESEEGEESGGRKRGNIGERN